MYTKEEVQKLVIQWVHHNIRALQLACKDFTVQKDTLLKTQPQELHQDILEQYYKLCKTKIAEEIGSKLGVDPMEAMITVEYLNMEDFFKL